MSGPPSASDDMTLDEALAVLDRAAIRFDAGLFLDKAVAVVKAHLAELERRAAGQAGECP